MQSLKSVGSLPIIPPRAEHLTGARSFQGIPGVAVTPGNRIFCVCYAGTDGEGPENYVPVWYSDDQGKTWTDAVAVAAPPRSDMRTFDPTLWGDPQQRLHLFWTLGVSTEGPHRRDYFHSVWHAILTNPEAAPADFRWTAPVRVADGLMMNKPAVLADGSWALPVSVWQCIDRELDPDAKPGAKMYVSTDNGETFQFRGQALVKDHAVFDEHSIVELSDGRLLMMIRTNYGNAESFSRDGGRTWTTPFPSKMRGPNSRVHLRKLPSGRLLCLNNFQIAPVNGQPTWRPRIGMQAWLSDDDGNTWYGGLVLDDRADVSYPDADLGPDGVITAVYDRERNDVGEILIARFREEDVAAGYGITPDAQFRIVASRTGGVRMRFSAPSARP